MLARITSYPYPKTVSCGKGRLASTGIKLTTSKNVVNHKEMDDPELFLRNVLNLNPQCIYRESI